VLLNDQVGENAGKVWHLLNKKGPQSLAEIPGVLKVPKELVNLAVGWLAREDKIEIVRAGKAFRVRLK